MKVFVLTLLALSPLQQPAPGNQVFSRAEDLVRVVQHNRVNRLVRDLSARHRPRLTAFVDVSVIAGNAVREHQTVVVDGGVFKAIGPKEQVRVPSKALVVDGAGKFLLPGLTDMHIHSLVDNRQKLLNLANGVTTVRDMDGFPFILEERDAIRRGELLAPNMYVAGTILNFFPMEGYARVVTSEQEARTAVKEQKRDGYEFIKVHNRMPVAIYAAIIDEARLQGLDVVGHAPRDVPLDEILKLGQHTLEHFKGYFNDGTLEIYPGDYVALTRGADVWLCPTFYNRRGGLSRSQLRELIDKSDEMKYVPLADRKRWLEAAGEEPDRINETIYRNSVEIFGKLLPAKARFLTGTDSGGGYRNHVPGFSLQHELESMEALGMPTADVLTAATSNAAQAMRHEREFGSIEVGKRADCILASKNPLETVKNLRGPKGVMVRGVWLSPETLSDMMNQLATLYADDAALLGSDPIATAKAAARDAESFGKVAIAGGAGREETTTLLGSVLVEVGLADDAIRLLSRNTREFPSSASAHAGLAEAYLAKGDVVSARRETNAALELDAGHVVARRVFENPKVSGPRFEAAGKYEITARMPSKGTMRDVGFTLSVTGADGAYSGTAALAGSPELPLFDAKAAGNRLWVSTKSGEDRIDFRLVVDGDKVRGTWAGDTGGATVVGSRVRL